MLRTLLLLALLAAAGVHADCDSARDQAAQALQGQARVAAYREIAGHCANFNSLYKLGRALQGVNAWEEALGVYEQARPQAGDARAEGFLYGRLAEVHLSLGRVGDAAAAADAAQMLLDKDAPPWLAHVRRAVDEQLSQQPISAESILAGLFSTRAFHVRPRVNLHVHFRSYRDSLTDSGLAQVEALGQAIERLPASARVQLIGHTDGGADDFAALRLSSMRAERVHDVLIGKRPHLASRLSFLGKGGQEPRHAGEDEATRKLNRRVEVVVTQP